MSVVAAILVLALTRAEIVDRFRAPAVTKRDGLIQVFADCPAEMRREYQMPIADFASEICGHLYRASKVKARRFREPGIVVHIGDSGDPKITNVISRIAVSGPRRFTRITLPSPSGADVDAFGDAVAVAFYLAVCDEEVEPSEARRRYRMANPNLRAADAYGEIAAWLEKGPASDKDDDYYLKLRRRVLLPGHTTVPDLLHFVSRLYLYPASYDAPFVGGLECCGFREAIALSRKDPRVRLAAYVKSRQVLIFGAGRSLEMSDAADAYSKFLTELAAGKKSDGELAALLDEAEKKLKEVKP